MAWEIVDRLSHFVRCEKLLQSLTAEETKQQYQKYLPVTYAIVLLGH